ncbi:hypothetical protein Skr01_21980 [Sphaerisporangium krabiense]|nr:hypothetical protein Skr01_21980 [Sphaerisporangium krabiense]
MLRDFHATGRTVGDATVPTAMHAGRLDAGPADGAPRPGENGAESVCRRTVEPVDSDTASHSTSKGRSALRPGLPGTLWDTAQRPARRPSKKNPYSLPVVLIIRLRSPTLEA